MPAPPRSDPSSDLLRPGARLPLDAFFAPRTVAVIGASERPGSVGRTLLWNLVTNPFGGTVFPVHPSRQSVLGIKAWPRVGEVPGPVDLAVIATPAASVPQVVRECGEAQVPAAIIISAGFKEVGAEGRRLEEAVREEAVRGRVRLMGPNCLGVMRPPSGLNATFAGKQARSGSVAFLSQSGALLTAILDWSLRERVGFSACVSLGSMLDVGWGDVIDWLGDDPLTRSILVYMESIGDARAFLSAAREVALHKPIIVLKAGRTPQAAQAAASHTGTLAGSDEALRAAFRRVGVVRVDSIAELFDVAEVLAKQPRPRGRRLTLVTNAGGPGVLATDALVDGAGELATLSEQTRSALGAFLPAAWSHGNPVDILGDADPDRYARALEVTGRDPASDGLLVILTPQDMTRPTETAARLAPYAHLQDRPVLACWMGGAEVEAGDRILNEAGIPTFAFPDAAARAFNAMWRYSDALRALYQTPSLAEEPARALDRTAAHALLSAARQQGRVLLTEAESKQLLASYGIPTVPTGVARTEEEAVAEAERLGFPVVLKLHSRAITHKTEVGGVRLGLTGVDAVRGAFRGIAARLEELGRAQAFEGVTVQPMVDMGGYELIVGSSVDSQLGPVLLFGAGGTLVEVMGDRALGLPPLNTTLARRMMERTRIFRALQGVRGRPPVDLPALERLLVRFSQLVVEQPWVREVDINPLLASHERLLALDARVVLHPADVPEGALPRPAIVPYPLAYVGEWTSLKGQRYRVRPIRPEDEPKMVRFHHTLSDRSVFLRYAGTLRLDARTAHERLSRLCFLDYEREMALVALRLSPEGEEEDLVAVGRLTRQRFTQVAEFAILVSDAAQGEGLGSELLRRLVEVGRDWKVRTIVADILPQNRPMQHVSRRLGFTLRSEEDTVRAVLHLP